MGTVGPNKIYIYRHESKLSRVLKSINVFDILNYLCTELETEVDLAL